MRRMEGHQYRSSLILLTAPPSSLLHPVLKKPCLVNIEIEALCPQNKTFFEVSYITPTTVCELQTIFSAFFFQLYHRCLSGTDTVLTVLIVLYLAAHSNSGAWLVLF